MIPVDDEGANGDDNDDNKAAADADVGTKHDQTITNIFYT